MINEISVKFPSQFLFTKITTSFDNNFNPLNTNNRFKAEKFEPELTFEKTMNETKDDSNEIEDNNLNIIASDAINIPAITSFEDNMIRLL